MLAISHQTFSHQTFSHQTFSHQIFSHQIFSHQTFSHQTFPSNDSWDRVTVECNTFTHYTSLLKYSSYSYMNCGSFIHNMLISYNHHYNHYNHHYNHYNHHYNQYNHHYNITTIITIITTIINPRLAWARVTVLVLCVCLCVCVFSLFWHLAQSGVQTAVSATSARYGHEI